MLESGEKKKNERPGEIVMKRKLGFMLFTILIFGAFILIQDKASLLCSDQTDEIGRVSLVTGNVFRAPGGAKVRLFELVKKGDSFTVKDKAKMRILFYSDSREEEARGACKISVTKQGKLNGPKGKIAITRKAPKFALPVNPSSGGRGVGATIDKIVGLAPVFNPVANVLEAKKTLTFAWQAPGPKNAKNEGPQYYLFIIERVDGAKKEKVCEKAIETTSFTLPEPLEAGKLYQCYVTVRKGVPPGKPGSDKPAAVDNNEDIFGMASNSPSYEFIMPSKEVISFLKQEEARIGKLKPGSDEWVSSAFFLINQYMTCGACDKAASLAKKINSYRNDVREFDSIVNRYGK